MHTTKHLQMGLGQAVRQLVEVEFARRMGYHGEPEAAKKERQMLLDALDSYTLQLGIDCDDGAAGLISESAPNFTQAAVVSCCRIVRSSQDAQAVVEAGDSSASKSSSRR